MRYAALHRAVYWLALACAALWAPAQEPSGQPAGLRADQHAWARFAPGAWKRVRVTTETLDANGGVESVSVQETTTRLDKFEAPFVTLHAEGSTLVGGQSLSTPAKTTVQGLSGQPAEGECHIRELPEGSVTIEDEPLDCRVEQVEVATPTHRTVTTNYYSERAPFLLRSESNTKELAGDGLATQTTMEVLAVDMPYRLRDALRPTAVLRMVHKHAKGSTLTIAHSSLEVPGGIVAYSSRERDAGGRVVRRSTLELLDYGGEPASPDAPDASQP